jgi:phosphoribosyl 1,2-cyclic phosphodiesterase
VDAGISLRAVEDGLHGFGLSLGDVGALLVTHEHSDHIKGLGPLLRKSPIPVYATAETIGKIKDTPGMGKLPGDVFCPIVPGMPVRVGGMQVTAFGVDHDAANPVAFRLEGDGKAVAVATDMGHFDDGIVEALTGLDALLLEANHDVEMLRAGSYPQHLKRRILGDFGHLSNENAGRLLNRIVHARLKHILLGHLSQENNHPALCFETVKRVIDEGEHDFCASDFGLVVAGRNRPSELVEW